MRRLILSNPLQLATITRLQNKYTYLMNTLKIKKITIQSKKKGAI